MPNHIHGIIKIKNKVETRHGVSLQLNNDFLRPAKGSLAAIVGQFKSSVKRWATKNDYKNFAWQRLYYDHIIRNETSLNKIREYIANNVIKWEIDEYHPDKIKILKNNF